MADGAEVDWTETIAEINRLLEDGSVSWAIANLDDLLGELRIVREALQSDLEAQDQGEGEAGSP